MYSIMRLVSFLTAKLSFTKNDAMPWKNKSLKKKFFFRAKVISIVDVLESRLNNKNFKNVLQK